jgi:NodT family efflux transporter outer membrane factor (OMF) lipoprotein
MRVQISHRPPAETPRVTPPLITSSAVSLALTSLLLTACNFAPHYERPNTESTDTYKEATASAEATGVGWQSADPKDDAPRSNWWEVFNDPRLNDLESRVAISNQSILAAEANYRAAYALVLQAQSQLFPTLSLVPSATLEKQSNALAGIGGGTTGTSTGATGTATGTPTGTTTTGTTTTSALPSGTYSAPHNIFSLPLEASYQIDLWGSIRNTVAADRFSAQASAATLANALLSTQSTLAQDYFQLRVADEQRRLLDVTVADYRENLKLVKNLFDNGLDSDEDVASAQTQLNSALASATDAGVARAEYEHAIAVLIGVPPGKFSIPYEHFNQPLPVVPVGVPAELLQRRPDIASAERQVAQANAQIGVARAAFFPTLTLTGSIGFESTALSNLFNAPNRFWSVGPSLSQVLFDGGERRAVVLQARAQYDSQVATYRQTVLTAFQGVEDQLAALRILSEELKQQHEAAASAQHTVELSIVRFRNGVDSYVNVITAENAFLSARESELQVKLKQLAAGVSLINDLGGGWSGDIGGAERLAKNPPDAGKPPVIPAYDAGTPVPNPPAIPPGETLPDEFIKMNDAAMTPPGH